MPEGTFETPVATRFKDVDAMGHVNNAVYVTYLEEARAAFARKVMGLSGAEDFDFVVARVEVDYRRPLLYGEDLRAQVRVSGIGTSSFTFQYRLLAGDDVVAEGRTVQVFYDYARGEKKPVPERFRAAAAPFLVPEMG